MEQDRKQKILAKLLKADLSFRINLIVRLNAHRRHLGLPEVHGLDVNRDNQKDPIFITTQELIDELATRRPGCDARKPRPPEPEEELS